MFKGYFINKNSTCKYPHCYVRLIQSILGTDIIWGVYLNKKKTDVVWGAYLNKKQTDVIWGDYSGGGHMTHNITASDCTMLNNLFMIENTWHKLQGTNPGNLQSYLYDGLLEYMNNPEWIIDIYYKLIVCRPDNWTNAKNALNSNNGKVNLRLFTIPGFTPSFADADTSGVYYGGYIENPSSPFDLPPINTLTDGNPSVQFPDGMLFDSFPVGSGVIWNDSLGNGIMEGYRNGSFLNLAYDNTGIGMMRECEQYNAGVITYVIDPSAIGLGIPYINNTYKGALPKLFTGFICAPQRKQANGFLYLCLGVHHI